MASSLEGEAGMHEMQCKQFQQALSTAIQHGRFKNKTLDKYIGIAIYTLQQHVCPRCVLRLMSHTALADFCQPVPSAQNLAAWLATNCPQAVQQLQATQRSGAPHGKGRQGGQKRPAEASRGEPGQAAAPVAADQPPAKRAHTDAAAAGAAAAPAAAVTSAAAEEPQSSAAGGEGEGHAAAAEPATASGPPQAGQHLACPLCLGILQQLDGTSTAEAAGEGSSTGSAVPAQHSAQHPAQHPAHLSSAGDGSANSTAAANTEQQPSGSGQVDGSQQLSGTSGAQQLTGTHQQGSSGAACSGPDDGSTGLTSAQPAAIAELVAAAGLPCSSFALELSMPSTLVTRECALHGHLAARFGGHGGVLTPWSHADIMPLKQVARRMLSGPLAAALGKQFTEGVAQADLTVALTWSHAASQPELVAVAQDIVKMQQRRAQGKHGGASQQGARQPAPGAAAPPAQGAVQGALSPEVAAALSTLTWERTTQQLSNCPQWVLQQLLPWPPSTPTPACSLRLRVSRPPLLLAGRYLKLRRNVPQSKWCDPSTGQRIGGLSVAEHIEALLLPAYKARATKFVSGGREDADVRMLGAGRPFVVEVQGPQRDHPTPEGLRALEQQMRDADVGVQVVGLKPCTKQALDAIKEAEETKQKTYQAFCWCSRPLGPADVTMLQGVQERALAQDTPVRVLHRRAPKVREKVVSIESVQLVDSNPHYFTLTIRAQAGTYIKEFCHGDWGRTCPSVGDLLGGGVRVEILQLDVTAVHMGDWP